MVTAIHQVRSILGVDALLTMEGIIPSVSLFRTMMRQRIVQLDATLAASDCPEEQKNRFCALLCRRIDTHIADSLARNHQHSSVETLEQENYPDRVLESESQLMNQLLHSQHSLVVALCHELKSMQIARTKPPTIEVEKTPLPQDTPASHPERKSLPVLVSLAFAICGLFLLWFCLKIY
ncbi:hypothetical protein GJV04_01855 [Enterobacteriaceae bacterium RIT714]|jgi:hypothetical protein|uniref:hypothetical protein n=1 Tax=Lelliottia sp. CFBP8978 TaxID=3096522 RepID=UPI0012AC5E64|nr:hypothetical protein [Lelliottia sp. CFBP8978]MDY1035603.1 hypothetical protein [Lelliottia sp. CFBP8978]MRS88782.1 hypothetical protein [Enterobacteriaceae bacterium RIT714]